MRGLDWTLGLIPVVVIVFFVVLNAVRILREYERGVIFRFGRQSRAIINPGGDGSGPGLILLIPFVDKMVKVSLRTVVMDVPPQDVITRDNVSVKVNAVIFFRVLDANKAVISVEDYLYATSQMAQTTLRSVLGQQELDDLLASREKINEELTRIIDQHTNPWGVKVAAVEVKNVDLPQDMQRAMSKQAEAERERRAKVINAEGEFQAAAKLGEGRGLTASRSRCSSAISRPCARWPPSGTPRPSSGAIISSRRPPRPRQGPEPSLTTTPCRGPLYLWRGGAR